MNCRLVDLPSSSSALESDTSGSFSNDRRPELSSPIIPLSAAVAFDAVPTELCMMMTTSTSPLGGPFSRFQYPVTAEERRRWLSNIIDQALRLVVDDVTSVGALNRQEHDNNNMNDPDVMDSNSSINRNSFSSVRRGSEGTRNTPSDRQEGHGEGRPTQ